MLHKTHYTWVNTLIKFSIAVIIFLVLNFHNQAKPINKNAQNIESNENKLSEKSFSKKYSQLLKAASKSESFSVQFTQEFYSIFRDKKTISKGNLSIKKPSSFLFEIESPRKEIYVTNGNDFWKYIPDNKHAQHLRASKTELNFLQILTDPASLKKFYSISPWTHEEAKKLKQSANIPPVNSDAPPTESHENLQLKLIPKGDKQQKVLYATIELATGFIQELRIVQLNGNRTRLIFSNYTMKPISQENFNFKPPAGIVVDNVE